VRAGPGGCPKLSSRRSGSPAGAGTVPNWSYQHTSSSGPRPTGALIRGPTFLDGDAGNPSLGQPLAVGTYTNAQRAAFATAVLRVMVSYERPAQ
jgi:hypothetical protein